MGTIASVRVEARDRDHVVAAIARLEAFWPGAKAAVKPDVIMLLSDRHDAATLASIWKCALLNERLVADGSALRQLVLADLVG